LKLELPQFQTSFDTDKNVEFINSLFVTSIQTFVSAEMSFNLLIWGIFLGNINNTLNCDLTGISSQA